MLLQENIPLAPLTTFRIGGPARYFVEAKSAPEVQEAVAFAASKNLPLFVLGGGSNLVVADSGWPGLVLKVAIPGIDQRTGHNDEGKVLFDVGAGESWDRFVSHAVIANCAGVECLSGIPGSVGGTPVQNVGAYGQEVSETIESVEVFDQRDGQIRELCAEACGFTYRSSIFNTTERGRFIILRVTYALTPGGEPHLEYADLQAPFRRPRDSPQSRRDARSGAPHSRPQRHADRPRRSRLPERRLVFQESRAHRSSSMQLCRSAPRPRDCTCPAIPRSKITKKFRPRGWSKNPDSPADTVFGHVGISSKHALAIVNRGGATAAEVLALKDQIQQRVKEIWDVQLEPEPVMLGF